MYESPVNVICGEMQTQIEGDIFKAIQNVGIEVDKEELIKAMQYDRNQYEKGYADGYADAIDEFLKKICEKYTEEESKGNYKQYCCNIKQELADIAEQLKGGE